MKIITKKSLVTLENKSWKIKKNQAALLPLQIGDKRKFLFISVPANKQGENDRIGISPFFAISTVVIDLDNN